MNFFSGLFPHFPGHSRENTGTGVRRRSQSPAERTPILPGKYSSTSRKKLRYSPKRTGNGSGREDILHPSEKISSFAREDILLPPLKIYLTRPLSRPFRARENKDGHDIVGR